jgi:predicted enzyme related to lactoylglutathione lyase
MIGTIAMTNANTPASTVDDALARHGRLSYLEIPALDPPRSAAFYQKLLGWHIENPDSPSPKFQNPTADLIGRFAKTPTLAPDRTFVPYFYVDRLHDLLPLIAPLGGEIVTPIRSDGDLWIATLRDPAGNLIGLWQDQAR